MRHENASKRAFVSSTVEVDYCGLGKVPNRILFFVDQGNSGSRKKRQQVSHAQQIQWKVELAQEKEEMCRNWPSIRQDSPL